MQKISKKIHKGFTLMEVMVSVSIFAIIVTVGIVALLSINNAYRKSEASRQTIDSLTYILESMSRRIRTAQSWTTTPGQSSTFTFVDQDGITVTYGWDQTDPTHGKITMAIDNSTCTPQPQCSTNANVQSSLPGQPYDLTPADVYINQLHPDGTPVVGGGLTFNVFGGTHIQSYVQMNLGGYSNDGKQISDFTFQTGISKRVLDQ
jgi:prepilin-type N-terminal cleavage/methylation domain-containing protein